MRVPSFPALRLLSALALALAVAACAPAPRYPTNASFVATTPAQVATAPGNFADAQVVWGGTVIGVDNAQEHTEIRILGYPLGASQRPRLQQPAIGRFIADVPGFLDPLDYPDGVPVTVLGRIHGAQTSSVGNAAYRYPVVSIQGQDLHRWTAEEMRQGHPNIHFGVGVGVGIR